MPVWNRSYSSEGTFSIDKALFVAADNTGNIIVTGVTNASLAGDDITTIKYDKDGNLLWIAVFNGSGNYNDRPSGLVTDNSDNIYITGSSTGSNGTATDILTLKYNKEGQLLWQKTYAGKGGLLDEARSIAVDGLGNVYISGSTAHLVTENSGQDWITIKYDTNGEVLWIKGYDDNITTDRAETLTIDHDGNLYVAGQCGGPGYHLAVAKYDSAGNLLWMTKYDGKLNSDDKPSRISTDGSGNVYITGYSNGGASGDDMCTIKYNSTGAEQWVKRYNGSANNDDYGNSIAIDNSGNSYVTGAVTRTGSDLDYITIKYDANGTQIWAVFYNGPGNAEDFPSSNAIDASGNIYVTGYSDGSGTLRDYCTVKYNNAGAQQWVQRYDGPDGWDEAWNIILDPAGNVYITGNSAGIGTGDDYCTIKYNSSGVQQWVARYTGPDSSNDYCNWVAPDANGNVYVTGIVGDGTGNPQNIVTIGYNAAGVQQWVQTYNGTGNEFDSGNALTVDNQGNVYVTGGSDNLGNTDFITFKYSSTIGIEPISTEIPQKYSLEQNYPNPFNPSTKIRFQIPLSRGVSEGQLVTPGREGVFTNISVYDISGRLVKTILQQNIKPGSYEITFDGTGLSSGVDFYKLVTNGFTDAKKMMLVK